MLYSKEKGRHKGQALDDDDDDTFIKVSRL